MFGIDNVLKVWDPRNRGNVLADEFPNMSLGEITSYRGITGHLYFPSVLEKMGQDLLRREYLVTAIIRDPVSQVLSLWNYINESVTHPSHERVKQMHLSQFVMEYTANQQSIFISGGCDGEKALGMAINKYDLVRPLKQINQFVTEIADHFGQPVPDLTRKNVTKSVRTRREDVDDSTLELIRNRNNEDMILYRGIMSYCAANKAA